MAIGGAAFAIAAALVLSSIIAGVVQGTLPAGGPVPLLAALAALVAVRAILLRCLRCALRPRGGASRVGTSADG